jgi:hypothetical protein
VIILNLSHHKVKSALPCTEELECIDDSAEAIATLDKVSALSHLPLLVDTSALHLLPEQVTFTS